MTEPSVFGDFDADDTEDIDWESVDVVALERLATQQTEINSIEDPTERKAAAKAWVAEMHA